MLYTKMLSCILIFPKVPPDPLPPPYLVWIQDSEFSRNFGPHPLDPNHIIVITYMNVKWDTFLTWWLWLLTYDLDLQGRPRGHLPLCPDQISVMSLDATFSRYELFFHASSVEGINLVPSFCECVSLSVCQPLSTLMAGLYNVQTQNLVKGLTLTKFYDPRCNIFEIWIILSGIIGRGYNLGPVILCQPFSTLMAELFNVQTQNLVDKLTLTTSCMCLNMPVRQGSSSGLIEHPPPQHTRTFPDLAGWHPLAPTAMLHK